MSFQSIIRNNGDTLKESDEFTDGQLEQLIVTSAALLRSPV